MSDAAAPAKKAAATKVKKVAKPSTHPKFTEMITAAVTTLADKKGSSLISIKKYILATYKVEEKTVSTFAKTNIKRMVVAGALKQVKGTGASGSFKLAEKPKVKKAAKKEAKSPKKAAKSPKKATKSPKKAAKSPKKAAKKTAVKKAAKPAKKAAKSPAKKPVAKKAKKPAAKKTAAKK